MNLFFDKKKIKMFLRIREEKNQIILFMMTNQMNNKI